MHSEERIVERLKQLIELGESVKNTRFSRSNEVILYMGDDGVKQEQAAQWVTSSQSFLNRMFGATSTHARNFEAGTKDYYDYTPIVRGIGILRAALDDLTGGWLKDAKDFLRAEVFGDMLEQAQYLLSEGYYVAATVLAGAVLEDALRQLCVKHGVVLPDKPKLDTMADDLVKEGAFNTIVMKQVKWLAGIRNAAAHGETDKFTKEDVQRMVPDVVSFLATHFNSSDTTLR